MVFEKRQNWVQISDLPLSCVIFFLKQDVAIKIMRENVCIKPGAPEENI